MVPGCSCQSQVPKVRRQGPSAEREAWPEGGEGIGLTPWKPPMFLPCFSVRNPDVAHHRIKVVFQSAYSQEETMTKF